MGMQKTVNINVSMFKQLWPYQVVDEIQKVMEEGEAKGKSGWEKEPVQDHLQKVFVHLHLRDVAIHAGINCLEEDHLTHAFCRLMMAVAIEKGYIQKGEKV